MRLWLPLTGAAYGYYRQFVLDSWAVDLGLMAVIVWTAGSVADKVSTWLAFRLKPVYDRRGLDFPHAELCPFLPAYPTMKEQVLSWSTGMSVLAIPVIFLLPGAGFYGGILRLLAAIANLRAGRQIRRELAAHPGRV